MQLGILKQYSIASPDIGSNSVPKNTMYTIKLTYIFKGIHNLVFLNAELNSSYPETYI